MTPNERITAILADLAALDLQKEALRAELATQRSLLEIKCASCGKSHAIKDLEVIQTHHYVRPHGCTGGDYWNAAEMQFICPETQVRNRLLFDNYDVPWSERDTYANNPEQQFLRMFGPLFRKVREEYEHSASSPWVNNYYPDRNRSVFGLVERRPEKKVA